MIDSFCCMADDIKNNGHRQTLGLQDGRYGVITFHRPSNVECPEQLKQLVTKIIDISSRLKLVFPVHPRTKKQLEKNGLYRALENSGNVLLIEPQSYLKFMNLVVGARLVITDSGGIQEETSYLGIPCLTVRENTERPITLTLGTNQLVSIEAMESEVDIVLQGDSPKKTLIPKWDGHAAERVVNHLKTKVFSVDLQKESLEKKGLLKDTKAVFSEESNSLRTETKDNSILVSWKPTVPDAIYRISLKKRGEDSGKTVYKGTDPFFSVLTSSLEGKNYKLRLEHNQGPNNDFTGFMTEVCLSEWFPLTEPVKALEVTPVKGALYYRFVVENIANKQKVIDRRVISPRLQVPLSALNKAAKHRWKAEAHVDNEWQSCGPSQSFQMPKRAITQGGDNTALKPKSEFLFVLSVDTEGQVTMLEDPDPSQVVDKHIFGKTPQGDFGINYIMDAFDQRGAKCTFFVDVLMAYQLGESETRRCIDAIMERGHDVQLHLHPSPNLRGAPSAALRDIDARWSRSKSPDSFRDALDVAYNLFYKFTGEKPIAFRNGSYHLEDEYLQILADYKILIDSSHYVHKNCRLALETQKNLTQSYMDPSGVLQIPLGWLGIENKDESTHHTQFTLKYGAYGDSLQKMISETSSFPQGQDFLFLNFIMHSYTLLKEKPFDEATFEQWNMKMKKNVSPFFHKSFLNTKDSSLGFRYTEGPFPERIQSFSKLLDTVADNPDIKIVTFKDIHEHYFERLKSKVRPYHPLPIYNRQKDELRFSAYPSYTANDLKQLCEENK